MEGTRLDTDFAWTSLEKRASMGTEAGYRETALSIGSIRSCPFGFRDAHFLISWESQSRGL